YLGQLAPLGHGAMTTCAALKQTAVRVDWKGQVGAAYARILYVSQVQNYLKLQSLEATPPLLQVYTADTRVNIEQSKDEVFFICNPHPGLALQAALAEQGIEFKLMQRLEDFVAATSDLHQNADFANALATYLTQSTSVLMANAAWGMNLSQVMSSNPDIARIRLLAVNTARLLVKLHQNGIIAGDSSSDQYVVNEHNDVRRVDLLLDFNLCSGLPPNDFMMNELLALTPLGPDFCGPFIEAYLDKIGP
ncbi:MAG TPA: hypothetical protein VMT55_04720, partial [Candidatus Sulfotelmatobacter sp.]|nr:hypothetical protein [Candidatus Sulfotelmatobacter sp.]